MRLTLCGTLVGGMLVGGLGLLTLNTLPSVEAADAPKTLKVAVVQMCQDPTLAENRDKIVRLSAEAAAAGARLAVFPEGALAAPPGDSRDHYRAAVEVVRQAAGTSKIFIVTGSRYVPEGKSKHRNQLYVFSPEGETLLVYNKDAFADKPGDPHLVAIDGVPCSFMICSDRWSRPVESLPPVLGAKVMIEVSNNYDTEWLPELGWYWYVPRAIRNTAFVLLSNSGRENRLPDGQRGHGHSAVIAPDGAILASAADERDKILIAELDLRQATREMAVRRSEHPLFKAWWEMGKALHAGQSIPPVEMEPLVSSNESVKCGFAVMPCSRSIEKNVETMRTHIRQAAADGLDLVVFPELVVTGDREEDIVAADAKSLADAVNAIRRAARQHKLTVVFGAPAYVGGQRRNAAYAIGPEGSILTRYDQIVVSRPELFEGGMSTRAMWFSVQGVWSILTIGDDVIWNEMGELAALKGARLHCHLRHHRHASQAEVLLHDQFLAAFASYRMLTVVANPLFPELQAHPDARFSMGSGIWDDLADGDWCAIKTHVGRPWEKVFSGPRLIPGATNPELRSGYWRKGKLYRDWMMAGAAAMHHDLAEHSNIAGD